MLNDNRAKTEHDILTECLSKGEQCLYEWDEYINKYWESYDIESNEQLPGLEQYQININDKTIIQPSIVTESGSKLSGTHFIVGGGFEDRYGYGNLLENFARFCIPYILNNCIPLYSWANAYFRNSFNRLTKFFHYYFYVESIGTNEIGTLSHLLTQFNMSNEALFMVGHSISGSTIKEISYITDIKGIVFEASNGRKIASHAVDGNFHQLKENTNKVANIYSNGMILSGNDNDFSVNGMLPHNFYNPNVYDTACQVAVSCSQTMKYIPFCKQVLTQGGNDPIQKFNEILDAYEKSELLSK